MFLGVHIEVVQPGTVVGQDNDGRDMIVTDDSAVFKGSRAWITQKVYDALKAKTEAAQ